MWPHDMTFANPSTKEAKKEIVFQQNFKRDVMI
jgi:hypothetical protein